jgi:uncharacterized protein (DUF924 family)
VRDDGWTAGAIAPSWVDEVLEFWFGDARDERWFTTNREFDEQIRRRFLAVWERLVESEARDLAGPQPLLAGIVVADQFSRNMFRGTSRAYAADPIARRLAHQVLALGLDAAMTRMERYFVYLPFEHSEDREHQVLAVRLIEPLGEESWTQYARAHQRVIERFGRFPHRNAILGRTSSPEELEFLKEAMGAF